MLNRIFVTAAVFLLAGLAVHADEPQKTGWLLTEAERAYVLKPEHERRPGVAQARWMCFSWAIASRSSGGARWTKASSMPLGKSTSVATKPSTSESAATREFSRA